MANTLILITLENNKTAIIDASRLNYSSAGRWFDRMCFSRDLHTLEHGKMDFLLIIIMQASSCLAKDIPLPCLFMTGVVIFYNFLVNKMLICSADYIFSSIMQTELRRSDVMATQAHVLLTF